MSTLPEQFSAARQKQVEAQITFFQNYAASAVANAEKIFALNLSTTKASMEKSSAAVRQLLDIQDPRDLLALSTQSQENFESLLAYGRELFSIATSSQAALLKQAAPVIAPPLPDEPKAPKAKPVAVPEAKAEAPAPKAVPAAPAAPKAKPVAKAKPAAAPFPVAVTPLKVVEAAPPAKSDEPKQLDMLIPKAKAKKTTK
jgi:phasin family protein